MLTHLRALAGSGTIAHTMEAGAGPSVRGTCGGATLKIDRAVARVTAILDQFPLDQQRGILAACTAGRFNPLTSTERSRKWRALGRDEPSRMNGDAERDDASRTRGDEASRHQRNGASRFPPHPPVVSSFFLQFWSAYPKKVGKGAATKSWNKQNLETKGLLILDALSKQSAFINRDGGKFIPNPATWLNENRWEDEPPQSNFLSEKTSGNVDAARAFVEGNRRK
jgi:hypothetical protein